VMWVVIPKSDGIFGVRVYHRWSTVMEHFRDAPKDVVGKDLVEWWEDSWAEVGERTLIQAVRRLALDDP